MTQPFLESQYLTVLVVDDDSAALYAKSRILKRQGYRVIEASCGTDALAIAAAERPDLVLLDVNLPDISGFEACELLKIKSETKHIKVLQTSAARLTSPDRVKSLEVGADAYLMEPVEEEELLGTVRALLTLAQQERDNRRLLEKLSRTERQLLDATEAAHLGIWDWDILTGKLEWFGEHERLAGKLPGGFSGKIEAFVDVLHPDDRARVWQKLEDLMARGETQYADEYRFIYPDGTERWMIGTGRLFYDEAGRAVRMTGVVQEISQRKQDEKKLRESETRFRTLASAVPIGIFRTDASGRCVYVNEWWQRIAGMKADEAYGSGWTERLHSDDRARVFETWIDAVNHHAPFAAEYRFVNPSGEVTWVLGHAVPESDGGYVGITMDITERKRTEDVLRQVTDSLSLAQRASGSGVWDWRLTENSVAFVSPEYRVLYGLRPDEPMTYEKWLALVHPDDRPRIERYGREVFQGAGSDYNVEFRIVHPRLGVRWLAGLGRIERNEAGEPIRFSGVNLDITSRKEAETALRNSEERLWLAFDGADMGSWDVDLRTGRATWNRRHAEMQGYDETSEPYTMQQWQERVHPDDVARVLAAAEQAKLGRTPFAVDHRLRLPESDEVRWLSLYGRFIHDENGRAVRFSGVSQDITERKKAEEALRQRNRQLDLLATISQELILGGKPERDLLAHVFTEMGRMLDMEMFYHYRPSDDPRVLRLDTFGGITDEERRLFATMPVGELLCGRVAARRQSLVVEDLPHSGQEGAERLVAAGAKSYAGFPLMARGELQGTLAFISRRRVRFHEGEMQTIQTICDQLATMLDRARLLREQRDSAAFYRQTVESIPGMTFTNTPDGACDFVSEQWTEFTGVPAGEQLGSGWVQVVHPEDRDRAFAAWRAAVEGRGEYDLEYRVRRADGVYEWFKVRGRAIRDADGTIARWFGTAVNVDDLKRAEQALRESEVRFRALVERIGDVFWISDPTSKKLIYVSQAFADVWGQDLRDLYDRSETWFDGIHKDDRARVTEEFATHIYAGTYDAEYRVVRPDGVIRWIRDRGKPLGVGNLVAGVAEDITDRKQAEDALHEAQARLRGWNVELEEAVNLKTAKLRQSQERLRALTSELNLAEQRERKRLATELHDHLQQMLVFGKITIGQGKRVVSGMPACETVLKKIDDILSEALTYSRTLVAELSPPVLRDHGLAASLKWLAEYMQNKHEHTVTVVAPDDQGITLPEALRVLLFQSVRELLINSAKHAGTGQATLTMNRRAEELHITVKDEGKGFDPPAASAAGGSPSEGISSKFGLYSIDERMQALGGSFILTSAPGQGTTATLVVPLVQSKVEERMISREPAGPDAARAARYPQSADHSTRGQSFVKVLLVDDHAMVRQGLRSVLDGYADVQVVAEARDGAEAVTLVEEFRPHVVVMDINMPKMNGIEATTQIKTQWPETTVIGISVNVGDENSDAMKRAGAVTLLTKEAAVEQLHDTIVQAVGF